MRRTERLFRRSGLRPPARARREAAAPPRSAVHQGGGAVNQAQIIVTARLVATASCTSVGDAAIADGRQGPAVRAVEGVMARILESPTITSTDYTTFMVGVAGEFESGLRRACPEQWRRASVGRKGECWDNAVAESVFAGSSSTRDPGRRGRDSTDVRSSSTSRADTTPAGCTRASAISARSSTKHSSDNVNRQAA